MKTFICVFQLCVFVGCTQSPTAVPTLTKGPEQMVLPFDHPPIMGSGGGQSGSGGGNAQTGGGNVQSDAGVSPDAGVVSTTTMGTRRLTVAQLKSSMAVVLGGATWHIGTNVGFDSRAAALGQPDYASVTDENLEASPLYVKFMADAARAACTEVATLDATAAQNVRVLTRFVALTDTVATKPADVNANLRYLKLRFHGIKVATTDDVSIAPYRTLFSAAVAGAAGTSTVTSTHVREGWKSVCVALFTAPEYHLY
jgi:hypothetical protein